MRTPAKIILFTAVFFFSTLSLAQECEVLENASIEKISDYLQHAGDNPAVAECVQAAFRRIGGFPPAQAIPLLIAHLGYKRPLNEGERHGFFMHGKSPDVLYPAVQQLYVLGSTAEPSILGFIGRNKDTKGAEAKNALYTLLLIHHGDVVAVAQELHNRSLTSTSDEARDRFQDAARDAVKWCDERARPECENAVK